MRRALVLCAGLAGCTEAGAPEGCGADQRQGLVGQPLSALEAAMPGGDYKVDYPLPDGTVTLEDFPNRLRVTVDQDDRILQVFCG